MTAALAHHAAARRRQAKRVHAEVLQSITRRVAKRAARQFDAANKALTPVFRIAFAHVPIALIICDV